MAVFVAELLDTETDEVVMKFAATADTYQEAYAKAGEEADYQEYDLGSVKGADQ